MVCGERTVLIKANSQSYSLRTTVPTGITKQFDLKAGDTVLWEIKPSPDGKSLMIVIAPSSEKNIKKNSKK
jgi:bifunctional DNA-binding transcriptional regulator/antitoxin component of YhaV-PrlF toxin-antitoxin module